MTRTAFIGLTLLAAALPLSAQVGGSSTHKPGDPRVKTALVSLGLTPNTDGDGDYKLLLKTENNRTQYVYIMSTTETYGQLEIREVWSAAFKTGGSLPSSTANDLLKENQRKKLGAWRLYGTGDNQYAVFAVQIAADADAESLKAALTIVTQVADGKEKDQVGSDDL